MSMSASEAVARPRRVQNLEPKRSFSDLEDQGHIFDLIDEWAGRGSPGIGYRAFQAGLVAKSPAEIRSEFTQSFTHFMPLVDIIATSEATTAGDTAYGDHLATTGPTIDDLPDGNYLAIYGAVVSGDTAADVVHMSPSPNGTTPVDNDSAEREIATTGDFNPVMNISTHQLLNSHDNTITLQYKQTSGTSVVTWKKRWLAVIRYAQPFSGGFGV